MNDTRPSYWAKNEMLTKINDYDDIKKMGIWAKGGIDNDFTVLMWLKNVTSVLTYY